MQSTISKWNSSVLPLYDEISAKLARYKEKINNLFT